MEKAQHDRFKDAPWYPRYFSIYVIVGGAGGIGSWISLLLARAGFKPIVYDFDILEEHNLGGQLYPRKSLGRPKVEALKEVIQDFEAEEIEISLEKIDESSPTHTHVISAFDNMAARKAMFTSWLREFGSDPNAIFIDGRLQAEHLQILCVRGGSSGKIKGQQDLYLKEYLFDDSEVEDAPCTMKQTSHGAAMIASHMVGFFTNHMTNITEQDETREVPFFWEYFIPMNLINQLELQEKES